MRVEISFQAGWSVRLLLNIPPLPGILLRALRLVSEDCITVWNILTLRSLEYMRLRTWMDDSEATTWRMISHLRVPMPPPSEAARTSSSKMMSTAKLSSLAISTQTHFCRVDIILKPVMRGSSDLRDTELTSGNVSDRSARVRTQSLNRVPDLSYNVDVGLANWERLRIQGLR